MIFSGVRVPVLRATYGDHIDRETGDYWTDYGKIVLARDIFDEKVAPKMSIDGDQTIKTGNNNPRRKITIEYECEDGTTDSDCLEVSALTISEPFPRDPTAPITLTLNVNQIWYGNERTTMNAVEA
jgi:hypothetical protein